ncbi:MAG: aminotransferase class I/II-fold pyridoxal phosphate-dependent enzyme, partial [Thermoanaerobaculia bacterium]
GIERVLREHLRSGDRVAVEDPSFHGILHLVASLGLIPVPFVVDDDGPIAEDLRSALASDVRALIVTPRAQNPTGAALSESRVTALRKILRRHPSILLVEDDHAGPVAGIAARTLAIREISHWVVVRSVSKFLGPDLRVAFLTGDPLTVGRVEARQRVGMRWVSFVLQELTLALLGGHGGRAALRAASRTYTQRRRALLDALKSAGIEAHGRSGLNVWIPVPGESSVVTALRDRGWAVSAGERFRLRTPPAIRVTISALHEDDASRFAKDLAAVLRPHQLTSLA